MWMCQSPRALLTAKCAMFCVSFLRLLQEERKVRSGIFLFFNNFFFGVDVQFYFKPLIIFLYQVCVLLF